MTTPVRIFIGSDIYNTKAEQALIHSIRRNTDRAVSFTLMDRTRNRGDEWQNWQHTDDWATCFSCFRWAIPAVCGFEGRGIYLDSDMIVLGDIAELWEYDLDGKAAATTPKRASSVMVFDCAKFADLEWAQLDWLKANAKQTGSYYAALKDAGEVAFIDQQWNCLDGEGFDPLATKLVHYTKLTTQPWHPAPHRFKYKPHERADLADLWRRYYEDSFSA